MNSAPTSDSRTAAATTVLDVRGLRVGVGDQELVTGVSFQVSAGQTLGIVGQSGSGKTLSVSAATGLFQAPGAWVRGSSVLRPRGQEGKPATFELAQAGADQQRAHGRHIGFVFQDPATNLNPLLTIEEQLTEGPRKHLGLTGAQARKHALSLLESVRLPRAAERLRAYPHQLSGGQRQRVMIAIALACDPSVLIADEPTTALDVTTQKQIIDLVAGLQRERGMAVVWISHDLGVIGQISDQVAVMREGEIVETNATSEIFAHSQHEYTRMLLKSRPIIDSTRHTRVEGEANSEPGNHPFGLGHSEQPGMPTKDSPGPDAPAGSPLSVKSLNVSFRVPGHEPLVALDDVSFHVPAGTTLGIVGESGSGKSTIANVLTGLIKPDSGAATLGQNPVFGLRGAANRAMRGRIAMVFQDPAAALDPRMHVQAAISEPLRAQGFKQDRTERVRELLADVGLDDSFLFRYPHEMSGGQRQRVCIARALAPRPEVLILDESTASLDVSVQAKVMELLREVQAARGYTMVFIAHDLAVVDSIATNVVVMENGRIVEQGETAQVLHNPTHAYTQKLLAAVPPALPQRA